MSLTQFTVDINSDSMVFTSAISAEVLVIRENLSLEARSDWDGNYFTVDLSGRRITPPLIHDLSKFAEFLDKHNMEVRFA